MSISSVTNAAFPVTSPASGAPGSDEKKLRKAAADLEGLFVGQLYKAMRATVPTDEGIVSGGSGEEIFTGLMDEHVAAETPRHWGGGISEALYRQLSRGLAAASETGLPSATTAVPDVPSSYTPGR